VLCFHHYERSERVSFSIERLTPQPAGQRLADRIVDKHAIHSTRLFKNAGSRALDRASRICLTWRQREAFESCLAGSLVSRRNHGFDIARRRNDGFELARNCFALTRTQCRASIVLRTMIVNTTRSLVCLAR